MVTSKLWPPVSLRREREGELLRADAERGVSRRELLAWSIVLAAGCREAFATWQAAPAGPTASAPTAPEIGSSCQQLSCAGPPPSYASGGAPRGRWSADGLRLVPFSAVGAAITVAIAASRRQRSKRASAPWLVSLRASQDDCPGSVTSGDMPSRYEASDVEEDLYKWWEGSGFFKPEVASQIPAGQGGHESYVLPMPPPNVTGRLHMGHAMFASLQDVLARFHRMYGNTTLWLPGTDHAGIATQMLVERQLQAEGSSRQEVGRQGFLDRVWAWKEEKGGAIIEQLRRMGASTDWSREQFTLNEHMSAAVVEAFVRLHEMGLIFRGKRMVNWSPKLQTAVSDLEVEYSEQNGSLYHFKYVVADADGQPDGDLHIPVATTRPETILGDSAVCVHPEDPRYQHLIGREVIVPMQERRIPVIADEYVDQEFGTGALKITPAHDFNDFEIAQRHNLESHIVIGLDGHIAKSAAVLGSPQYVGLYRAKCRKALWADMEESGLTLKVEDHMQRVPLSQRSGEVIEPMLSDQWFVSTEEMSQRAMDAVANGDIRIQPDRYVKIWNGWLKEKQPWCISRQLWWGHRIPVYYPAGELGGSTYFVARSPEEAAEKAREALGKDVELEQDPDVLDTWFSSGLWPFATVGWPNERAADYQKLYPATMLETGYDILFFWVARMVMMGLTLTDKAPFKEIYLHGLVRDEKNQKMSKTKGNVVDPLDTIAEYGTDALRFSLLTNVVPGQDVPLGKGMLDNAKGFVNKIWNVGRFIITEYEKSALAASGTYVTGMTFSKHEFETMPWLERALISKCHRLIERTTEALKENRFQEPTKELSEFVREDFASWYLEISKTRLQPHLGGDPSSERAATSQRVLLYVLEQCLKLLHPFMPFITEAVWQRLPKGEGMPSSLMVTPWTDVSALSQIRDEQAEAQFATLTGCVSQIRNARAEHDIPPKDRVPLALRSNDAAFRDALEAELGALAWVARADGDNIQVRALDDREDSSSNLVRIVVSEGLEVDMPVPEKTVDIQVEVARLSKQLNEVSGLLEGTEKKITPQFMERANPQAREKILQKAEDLRQKKEAIEAQLAQLEGGAVSESRRQVVASLLAAACLVPAPPAQANVGEGDTLPQGARQENRITVAFEAWQKLGERVKLGKDTDEEWQNTQGFLRRLYTLNDDMGYLASGFLPDKRKKAEDLITKFKKRIKEADKPAKAKDTELFMKFHQEITGYIVDFQDYLVDAPADLDFEVEEVVLK